jgi:F0F1-type ATP synthase delta subunit
METSYAQALWKMISNGMEPSHAVHAVHAQLKARGREALLPRIARAFGRLAAREHARNTITLTIADTSHAHTALKQALATLEQSDIQASDVNIHIDTHLIGGWRIEGREQLVDASYKKHLLAIYTAATS